MTPQDYDFLRKLLKQRSGLVLSSEKQYLAESRLLPIARRRNLAGLHDLIGKLKGPGETALMTEVVEAMTTNETFFFRDKRPFEHFRDAILPALLAARASEKRLRIWCTAASTGQEPYSLAMALREVRAALDGWRIDILATDLSGGVLERAKAGIYSQFEVQRGLPIALLVKYFTQAGEQWQIAQSLRDMVRFRPINLLNDFSALGAFDLVFCRNVLIYFDQDSKTDVLNRIARQIPADGYLVLGAAETVVGLTHAFRPVPDRRGLYAPNTANCGQRGQVRGAGVSFLVPPGRALRAADRSVTYRAHRLDAVIAGAKILRQKDHPLTHHSRRHGAICSFAELKTEPQAPLVRGVGSHRRAYGIDGLAICCGAVDLARRLYSLKAGGRVSYRCVRQAMTCSRTIAGQVTAAAISCFHGGDRVGALRCHCFDFPIF